MKKAKKKKAAKKAAKKKERKLKLEEFQFYVIAYREKVHWTDLGKMTTLYSWWYDKLPDWCVIPGLIFDSLGDAETWVSMYGDSANLNFNVFSMTSSLNPNRTDDSPWYVGAFTELVDERTVARIGLREKLEKFVRDKFFG